MKMSPQLEDLFNRQITIELASSNAYLQMAAYLESRALVGMAAWMRIQADEERAHAIRFIAFALDRDNAVAIGAMEAPQVAFGGPSDVFEAALAAEQRVTASITEMYVAAQDAADVASLSLLQEFLAEQVEEESTVGEVVHRLALAGKDGAALLDIDRELGGRAPGPPA